MQNQRGAVTAKPPRGATHPGDEARENNERSAPCPAPYIFGHAPPIGVGQYLVFERIVGDVHIHKKSGIEHHGRRCEPRAGNPSSRERQKRHQKQMNEVDPDQSECRSAYEAHQVMMINPNNHDEKVARRIAQRRGPQRPDRPERRLLRRLEFPAKTASENAVSRSAVIRSSRMAAYTAFRSKPL